MGVLGSSPSRTTSLKILKTRRASVAVLFTQKNLDIFWQKRYYKFAKTIMNNNLKIQQAIKFATKTHEVYQKQKRKGKDIPYIIHPLTVGLLLSQARASDNVVMAGILHDTIEDSIEEKKVSHQMLKARFGKKVADLVLSVTEAGKDVPWEERKKQNREHIKTYSRDSLLLKSADLVANLTETLDDYYREGKKVFDRFNAPKKKVVAHILLSIQIIGFRWKANPLLKDLRILAKQLKKI